MTTPFYVVHVTDGMGHGTSVARNLVPEESIEDRINNEIQDIRESGQGQIHLPLTIVYTEPVG